MGRRKKGAPAPERKDPRKNNPWNPKGPVTDQPVLSLFEECPQGHMQYRFQVERGECNVCDRGA